MNLDKAVHLDLPTSLSAGLQGDAIGDVKFNKDGDRIGRYSIYQYQYVDEDAAFKYVLVGEFGDFPALEVENDPETG